MQSIENQINDLRYACREENLKAVNSGKYSYRLGTNTCLAGDIIGDYSFEKPLYYGQAMVIVRRTRKNGKITLAATADGFRMAKLSLGF